MKNLLFIAAFLGILSFTNAQTGHLLINGQLHPYTVDECGDTLILAQLDDVSVSSPRKFETREDYRRYLKYKRYAVKVYPYAVKAIKIFREVEYATENMKNAKRKKYIKKLQKDLKTEFEDPLKKLTKTQGKILFKMIERELDTPMYFLIKDLRGGLTASYWGTVGRLYGHRLKDGYIEGEDMIMDAVLNDLNISYDITSNR
jgi:hypothetical protein